MGSCFNFQAGTYRRVIIMYGPILGRPGVTGYSNRPDILTGGIVYPKYELTGSRIF